MYEINNSPKFKQFKLKELVVRWIFTFIIILNYLYGCIAVFIKKSENHHQHKIYWNIAIKFQLDVPNALMVIVSIILLYFLRKNFHYQFIKLYPQILCFSFFISSIQLLAFILEYFDSLHDIIIRLIYHQGYFLMIYSLAFNYLKKAKDPLEGISLLGYL